MARSKGKKFWYIFLMLSSYQAYNSYKQIQLEKEKDRCNKCHNKSWHQGNVWGGKEEKETKAKYHCNWLENKSMLYFNDKSLKYSPSN